MHAEIIGLGQQLSLMDGSSSHLLTIALPSGATFSALVDDQVAQLVTEEFVAAGSVAAHRAVQAAKCEPEVRSTTHPALAQQQVTKAAEVFVAQEVGGRHETRSYAPMVLEGEQDAQEDTSSVFGGDFSGPLAAVGEQLRHAEQHIAQAIVDVDPDNPQEMRVAANRLRGIGDLPTPKWAIQQRVDTATSAEMPKIATKRALRVAQDEAGNPVLRGPGVVNHRALLGGTDVEEGDAGQL